MGHRCMLAVEVQKEAELVAAVAARPFVNEGTQLQNRERPFIYSVAT